jgi:hypothetical protein
MNGIFLGVSRDALEFYVSPSRISSAHRRPQAPKQTEQSFIGGTGAQKIPPGGDAEIYKNVCAYTRISLTIGLGGGS